jgi:hypothetical protein
MEVYLGKEDDMKKCRLCSRFLRPRTISRPSVADPTVCQVCSDLTLAFYGKRPEPKRKVA